MTEMRVRDRAAVIDEGVARLARWGLRIIVIVAAALVIGWIIGQLWVVFFPVSMALIVTSVLQPIVSWLRGKGWPSALASALVMITFVLAIVMIVVILTPLVAGQAADIASGASDGLQKIRGWVTGPPLNLSEGQMTNAISAIEDRLQDSASAISSGVFSTIGAATSAVVNLVVVLLLTFFFVKDGHRFTPWARSLGGRRAGKHIGEVLGRAWGTLGAFIRIQTLVSFIDAAIIGTGLVLLDVELAIPLAVLTFFGGYIPIVGAFASGAVAVLVTLVTNDVQAAFIALLIIIAVQQLEGNVLSPWLQGKKMNLHPAVVLLSVTAGGSLFGIVGAFLAVPAVASATEVLRYVNERIDEAVDDDAPAEDKATADDPA